MKYHIINYMRPNEVYICAQMKYLLRQMHRSKQNVGIISQGKTENVFFVGMGLGMNFIFCSYVKMKLL
jgi:hypothetical protein